MDQKNNQISKFLEKKIDFRELLVKGPNCGIGRGYIEVAQ
jgi:hypothetical protein